MSNKTLSSLCGIVAALALSACDPMLIEGCESTEEIKVYCGFEKPEDIEPLGDHPWLLISELGDFGGQGAIAALNVETDEVRRLEAVVIPDPNAPQCGAPPAFIRPRGFHVSDRMDGTFKLLVVNAADGERIEFYDVDIPDGGPGLYWRGCVSVPDTVLPNDVAATGYDGFVVSHMLTGPRTWWLQMKFFFGLKTGHAAAWSPDTGWRVVDGTEASFPNGVEADPDTSRVFIGSTYGQTFIAADVAGGNERVARIPVQSDNLTWTADGKILSVGHTGIPLWGTSGCREALGTPCSFPFAVVEIDPVTFERAVIYEHDDGLIPGASVALAHKGYLYMGTVFGDRISRVRLQE